MPIVLLLYSCCRRVASMIRPRSIRLWILTIGAASSFNMSGVAKIKADKFFGSILQIKLIEYTLFVIVGQPFPVAPAISATLLIQSFQIRACRIFRRQRLFLLLAKVVFLLPVGVRGSSNVSIYPNLLRKLLPGKWKQTVNRPCVHLCLPK